MRYFHHEQTYRRKIEELFLAVEIEKNYTKDEILNMYLNQVYFGSGAWGIDQASKNILIKILRTLRISEAAMLAGLLQVSFCAGSIINIMKGQ